MTRSSAGWLPRDQEWLWLRWLLNKHQRCLPLSLSINITLTISGTDCTDLRRDGQSELASVKQDVFQNRPWLICGKRTVVDSMWFESVSAISVTSKIRFLQNHRTRSFYSYAGFVLVNCTTDLSIVLVIVVRCLSCIRSVAKLYTAIHERFSHVLFVS